MSAEAESAHPLHDASQAEPHAPSRASLRQRLQRRFGLRATLLALLLPCIGLLLLVDNWIDYRMLARQLEQAYDQSLLEPAQALIDAASAGPEGIEVELPFAIDRMFAATSSLDKYLALRAEEDSERPGAPPSVRQLLGDPALALPPVVDLTQPVFYDSHYQGRPVRVVALARLLPGPVGHRRVVALAAEGTEVRGAALTLLRWQMLARDVWQLLTLVLCVWLCVGWTLRPLERLRHGLGRLPGDTPERPLDAGAVPREVQPLVEVINQHIQDRRQAVEAQARFLADASHQLRTPLAIMFAQARYAARETRVDAMREGLEAIIDQLDHSRRLAEQLLSLAHATQAPQAPQRSRFDLNQLARQVLLQYLALAHEKNLDLGWQDARGERDEPEEANDADETDEGGATAGTPARCVVPVFASEVEAREVIANLLHNAIRYTPVGGRITVAVQSDLRAVGGAAEPAALRAWVEVIDDGPGIAPSRRQQVFERFQRDAQASVAGQPKGAGLGLSIARAYARRNGGDIELGDAVTAASVDDAGRTAAVGLRARFWLPLAPDAR